MADSTILLKFLADQSALDRAIREETGKLEAFAQATQAISQRMGQVLTPQQLGALSQSGAIKTLPQEIARALNIQAAAAAKAKAAMDALAQTKGLERIAANILGPTVSIKELEASAYSASRGMTVLAQTIVRDPVRAFGALASGTALAGSGLTSLRAATALLNESLAFVVASRFGVIAGLGAAFAAVASTIRTGVQAQKEYEAAMARTMRLIAAEGESVEAQRPKVQGLVNDMRSFAAQNAVTVESLGKTVERLVSAGVEFDVVRRAFKDFGKFQIAFPEINLDKFTQAAVGLYNQALTSGKGFETAADKAALFQKILDELNVTAAIATFGAEAFPTIISHLSAAADTAGLTRQEMLALEVAVTKVGLKSESSARLLRGMILTLAKPEKMAFLEEIGVRIDKTKSLGSQLQPILKQINDVAGIDVEGGLTVKGLKVLGQIFPTEQASVAAAALKGLAADGNTYSETLAKIQAASGATDRAAAEMQNTLQAQTDIFSNLRKEIAANILGGTDLKEIMAAINDTMRYAGAGIVHVHAALSATMQSAFLAIDALLGVGKALEGIFSLDPATMKKGLAQAEIALGGIGETYVEKVTAAKEKAASILGTMGKDAAETLTDVGKKIGLAAKIGEKEWEKLPKAVKTRFIDLLQSLPELELKIKIGQTAFDRLRALGQTDLPALNAEWIRLVNQAVEFDRRVEVAAGNEKLLAEEAARSAQAWGAAAVVQREIEQIQDGLIQSALSIVNAFQGISSAVPTIQFSLLNQNLDTAISRVQAATPYTQSWIAATNQLAGATQGLLQFHQRIRQEAESARGQVNATASQLAQFLRGQGRSPEADELIQQQIRITQEARNRTRTAEQQIFLDRELVKLAQEQMRSGDPRLKAEGARLYETTLRGLLAVESQIAQAREQQFQQLHQGFQSAMDKLGGMNDLTATLTGRMGNISSVTEAWASKWDGSLMRAEKMLALLTQIEQKAKQIQIPGSNPAAGLNLNTNSIAALQ